MVLNQHADKIKMTYFLSLGSNVGDKTLLLQKAVESLAGFSALLKKSALYQSAPVGETDQDDFLNAMLKIETELNPHCLLEKIKNIEEKLGRQKRYRWGPREIDIDIIEYYGPLIRSENLNIPHMEMEKRTFVLQPLLEIEPGFKARDGRLIKKLLDDCGDETTVTLLKHDW
jgi:2-amino-4-hydroxy-6-hydroxymethyldihydropteridine diphosphokinase